VDEQFSAIVWAHFDTCNDEVCALCAVPDDHEFVTLY
jgi:hypothetical protein